MKTSIESLEIGQVTISGWIEKIRDQNSMQFIILKDRSGKVQITVEKEKSPEIAAIFSSLTTDSYVEVEGDLVENQWVKLGGREILPTKVTVQSKAEISPIDSESSIDQRLDYRWIDL